MTKPKDKPSVKALGPKRPGQARGGSPFSRASTRMRVKQQKDGGTDQEAAGEMARARRRSSAGREFQRRRIGVWSSDMVPM